MTALQNKKILLGVSGGIAAYKSAILARRLMDAGATVRVVMTAGAQAFVQPLTFQALTGNPVHTQLLDPAAEAAMGHIELARWADLVLIAPASANTLARLAHGLADDLLGTLCLATDSPLYVAPAMNRLMWSHPATVTNCQLLAERGVGFIGPDEGAQACGETGAGRLLEPEDIRDRLIAQLHNTTPADDQAALPMAGVRVLLTAGPTREPIDPVRYISNRSSGKMGFAIAEAANKLGARVTIIAGPVSLSQSTAIKRIDVLTASSMLDAVLSEVDNADIFISVAILKTVAALDNKPYCVGFAAETQQVQTHAIGKLEAKNLDMIAANHVGQVENPVFGSDTNALDVFWKNPDGHGHEKIESGPKTLIAEKLLAIISHQMTQHKL